MYYFLNIEDRDFSEMLMRIKIIIFKKKNWYYEKNVGSCNQILRILVTIIVVHYFPNTDYLYNIKQRKYISSYFSLL